MATFSARHRLPAYLRDEASRIEGYAKEFGLCGFPLVFEMVSYSEMNQLAAFGGFPSRYPHWRFGMEYERLSKSYEYGLSKIYEMVINNNPAIAYLLEGNSLVEQKLVMAHVYAHVDFFRNNFMFNMTNQGRGKDEQPVRKWIDTLANHGATVRKWANRFGVEKVEEFVDCCLSLDNLIDPRRPYIQQKADTTEVELPEPMRLPVQHDYMESFINPEGFIESQRKKLAEKAELPERFPEKPVRDILGFLLAHAPLERWERDILSVIRREALYFFPQAQTKIMNEGWATYWHSKIMTEKAASGAEIIDYADRCAGVLATSGGQLNPYKLGVELFRHIEERWNKGQFGKEWEDCEDAATRQQWNKNLGLGAKKIFEVRAHYNDITFIDEFLTPEFVAHQKMYAFGYNERHNRWEIESRTFKDVKDKLLFALTNAGQPFVYVDDANAHNRGELRLRHDHQSKDIKLDQTARVLESIARVWKRPVSLVTKIDDKETLLRYDGSEHSQTNV